MFVNIVKSLLQMFSKNSLIQDLAVIPDLFLFFFNFALEKCPMI